MISKIKKEKLDVRKVCNCKWSKKIRSYWRRFGLDDCYVLLGKTNGFVLLIKIEYEGKDVYGLMFSKKLKFKDVRNILWHEAGHILGEQSEDPVMKEFNADKWAIDNALKRGYKNIVREIIFRSLSLPRGEEKEVYKKASDMIVTHFKEICEKIIKNEF